MRVRLLRMFHWRLWLPILTVATATLACRLGYAGSFCANSANHSGTYEQCMEIFKSQCPLPFEEFDKSCQEGAAWLVQYHYPPAPPPTPPASLNCADFRLTSPLDGLSNGMETFYWDPLPNAQRYEILIYDENGTQRAAFIINAPATNLTGDVSTNAIGGAFNFRVVARAIGDNNSVCTVEHTMLREAPPPISVPVEPASSGPVCGNNICEPGEFDVETGGTCPTDCT